MKHVRLLAGGGLAVLLVTLIAGVVPSAAYGLASVPKAVAYAAAADSAIIVDHASTDITAIPQAWIEAAKSTLRIGYGHTSHGSQLTSGMSGLVDFADDGGLGLALPEGIFEYNYDGSGGALYLRDGIMAGDCGYHPQWVNETRDYLGDPDPTTGRGDAHPDINVIIWSWCGQVNDRTEETMLSTYLTPMSQLEVDYPGITFVYMTGHANGGGEEGNVHQRNQQIREYCIANNKVLYDFYDIELYDPDGNYYGDQHVNDNCDYDSGNWATDWQGTHTQDEDWYSCSCAHSQSLNCNQKAYAAWWLWARIAGWDGVTGGRPESDQNGNWTTPVTWVGDIVPSASDAITITSGTAVTVDTDVQCQRLAVEHGATLIIPQGVTLTVADSVDNQGTMQQTRTVNGGRVPFLEVDDPGGIPRYRGAEIEAPDNLGMVTVSMRVLGDGEYCTSAGAASPVYAGRCFEIEAQNNAAATVRLWALDDEMNGVSAPHVFRYVAPNWIMLDVNASTGTWGAYTYAEAGTPGFSHFLIAQDGDAPNAIAQLDLEARDVWLAIGIVLALVLMLMTGIGLVVYRLQRKSSAVLNSWFFSVQSRQRFLKGCTGDKRNIDTT